MELLKLTHSRIAPLLQSITPATRVIAAVGLLLAVGAGSYFYNHRGTAESVYLFGGRELATTEIAAVETALGKAGQNDYEVVQNRILVPQDQRAVILRAIDDADATPKSITGYDSSPTTFAPFPTGQQQRNQDKAKKQEKICAMIREIQGIENVLVEYDESRSQGFPRTTQRTAAVTVRPESGRYLEAFEIKTIRATVQRAVAGLQPEDIVVIDGNSGISHDWQDQQEQSNNLQDYATAKQYFEDSWKQKIESVLKCYPGVRVDVHVDFDRDERANRSTFSSVSQESQAHPSVNSLSAVNAVQAYKTGLVSGSATPGSNGHARVQESMFSAQRPELVAEKVETNDLSGEHRDYVPTSASVSIGVPTNCVCRLVSRKQDSRSRAEIDTPAVHDPTIPALSQSQITERFEQIKADIISRVIPLLPGRRQLENMDQYIAVSLDPDVESVAEVATPHNDDSNFFAHFNSNWYALLIPAVVVAGVVLVRIGNRTHMLPVPDNHEMISTDADESIAGESPDQPIAFNEILHNDLEPTEKDVQLATDIDRAFESDYQTSLSNELVEAVEDDPRATISVFRSWLSDAA